MGERNRFQIVEENVEKSREKLTADQYRIQLLNRNGTLGTGFHVLETLQFQISDRSTVCMAQKSYVYQTLQNICLTTSVPT